MNPFISVITVVRNDKDGLEITGNSIATQKYCDLEWIVVDGASTDGTVEYLREKHQVPCIWISESDNGIYDAMNKGVSISNGKYAVFMNAGDVFASENVLKNVKDTIDKYYLEDVVVYGGAMLEFPNGRKYYRPPKFSRQYIWHGLPANHQATYYPIEWLSLNPYANNYSMCGDYYIAACAHKAGLRSVYIDSSLVKFRIGDTSYNHPIKLVYEAYNIQRSILGFSIWSSLISSLRRIMAISATVIIYNLPKSRSAIEHPNKNTDS